MTDSEFVAAVCEIVEDKKALEHYRRTKPAEDRDDIALVRADAFQQIENLVQRYRDQKNQLE